MKGSRQFYHKEMKVGEGNNPFNGHCNIRFIILLNSVIGVFNMFVSHQSIQNTSNIKVSWNKFNFLWIFYESLHKCHFNKEQGLISIRETTPIWVYWLNFIFLFSRTSGCLQQMMRIKPKFKSRFENKQHVHDKGRDYPILRVLECCNRTVRKL